MVHDHSRIPTGAVTPPLPDGDDALFTNSACELLACELNALTGWPVVVVGDDPDYGAVGWVHAGVELPDGRIVDVRGVHDPDDWVESWGECVDAYGVDVDDYDCDSVDVYPAVAMMGSAPFPVARSTDQTAAAAARRVALTILDRITP